MELPVILKAGEDGFIVAECPVIPGCVSQGRTRREALRNVREAIELCLETRAEEGWDLAPRYDLTRVIVATALKTGGRKRRLPKDSRVSTRTTG